MYQLVETLKKTYLCEASKEDGRRLVLTAAVEVGAGEADEDVARGYLRAVILGRARTVSVSQSSVESVQDAEEVGPLVELMLKYLPLAEKNAKASAVLEEVTKLVGKGVEDDG